jgi:hypothetical protein
LELELAIKAPAGSTPTTASSAAPLPSDRSPLRATASPSQAPTGRERELAEAVHACEGEGGLRQAAKRLGIHRDALKAAFGQ